MDKRGRQQPWRSLLRWGAGLGVLSLWSIGVALAREPEPSARPNLATVALAELPVEAQATHRAIRAGGPFHHVKDGSVFGNRERLLPREPRGFYREYTVATPSAHDRGGRRIVCGGSVPVAPEACYYTGDHYSSFRRIAS